LVGEAGAFLFIFLYKRVWVDPVTVGMLFFLLFNDGITDIIITVAMVIVQNQKCGRISTMDSVVCYPLAIKLSVAFPI
jgi:hypothetical protein